MANDQRTRELEAFYDDVEAFHSAPLWTAPEGETTDPEPRVRAQPYLWRWSDMRPLLLRAGDLVSTQEAERRVLTLKNPGLATRGATNTLTGALQLVKPGEIARTHRHTASALRMIIEGHRAYTAVDGEKTLLDPGDFVTTPNWTWHDHGNETDQPIMWLDGLDAPLTRYLGAWFYEQFPEERQPLTKPVDGSQRRYGAGSLRPTWERDVGQGTPLLNYRWDVTYQTLNNLAQETEGSPFDGVCLEYVNPRTGGPAFATMACFAQLFPPGYRTQAHRHTGSTIYHVVKGDGYSVINGERFDWSEKDIFVVPSWAVHEHANGSDGEDAVLFSYNDSPTLQRLGFYREAPYADAHQEVTRVFGQQVPVPARRRGDG